ncbi:RNA polymerase ECF-type sigma factor SigK [Gordonia otitidis NBRC 100426]|uniref:RNA polymerase ECF-type sigma factor SigK n=1 Tax=Gordonia otitidis (strain DSM 44809 / CCUG 52243 / JCM 12355 / NBRC 100426 / IFM 10032) TaxID=1108044 RepID=H5TMY0_GORO1|nr:RNA polymerase ECF-type sigma factor SigK [Gordonia otitidis NBRC 100426]
MTALLTAPRWSATDPGWLRPDTSPIRVNCDERRGLSVTADHDAGTRLPILLEKIASGDETAFSEFYDLTSHRVYGMVLRVLRDPGYSEETTQEVYLQVWRSASTFRPELGSALSWLITLAHRRAVDRVRSETASARREETYGAEDYTAMFDEVSEAVDKRETSSQVRGCLETLTDVQRESIGLAYYEGLTYREVSERLSVALPTIKSRIRDGLARLRTCLGGADV